MKDTKEPTFSYESAINELELIVDKLGQGDLTLEESLLHFEKGIALARQCQQTLNQAEQKVQQLIEQNGSYIEQPLEPEN